MFGYYGLTKSKTESGQQGENGAEDSEEYFYVYSSPPGDSHRLYAYITSGSRDYPSPFPAF